MLKFEIYEIDGGKYIKLEDLKKSIKEISSETRINTSLAMEMDQTTLDTLTRERMILGLARTLFQENTPTIMRTKEIGFGGEVILYTSKIYLLNV